MYEWWLFFDKQVLEIVTQVHQNSLKNYNQIVSEI